MVSAALRTSGPTVSSECSIRSATPATLMAAMTAPVWSKIGAPQQQLDSSNSRASCDHPRAAVASISLLSRGRSASVMGDSGEVTSSSLGVEVLRNATATLERGGAFIDLAGINDVSAPSPHAPDLGLALGERTPDRFTLLAAHQPVQALDAVGAEIDLQLSGHTHAGQLWPLRYLVPLQQPSIEGLVTVAGIPVFTTRGAGTWGPPVRVGAEPEISMLELHSVGA